MRWVDLRDRDSPLLWSDPTGLFETRKEAREYKKEHHIKGSISKLSDGTFSINDKKNNISYSKGDDSNVGMDNHKDGVIESTYVELTSDKKSDLNNANKIKSFDITLPKLRDLMPNFKTDIGGSLLKFKGLHYGVPEFETSLLKNSAVTPGPFVLYPPGGSKDPDLNTHEPGHVLQFLILGTLYYPVIALPSVLHASDPKSNTHYHEKTANQLWYWYSGESYKTNPVYKK